MGLSVIRDEIIERLSVEFSGINSSLHRLESLSAFLSSFLLSAKCYSQIDSSFLVPRIFYVYYFEIREESGLGEKGRAFCQLLSKNFLSGRWREMMGVLGYSVYAIF
jgi:hypothetical protein